MVKCIKCGDTEFCANCKNNDKAPAEGDGYLVLNELGRCDFYDGPDNRKRGAHTHGHAHDTAPV